MNPLRRAFDDATVLARAGVLRPLPPRTFVGVARAVRKWDRTPAGAVAQNALRYGDRTCIVDERGTVSFAELHRRTNALANAFAADGLGPGRPVGLLARDSRWFVETVIACSKLGADLVLLNTGFSAPQLSAVLDREDVAAIVHDEEFAPVATEAAGRRRRYIAWSDGGDDDAPLLDELVAGASDAEPAAPDTPGRQIALTSGTTGTPKGARRPPVAPTDAVVGFLDRVPVRAGRTHFVVAPLFHVWGFAHMGLGLMLGARVILRRRFDPEQTLATIDREKPDTVAMVPVMAQRILDLPEDVRARYDASSMRIVAFGGSAIPGDLAVRFMDAYGDVVYNAYGSTEVAMVSIATPSDLRANPHTAGRPVSRVVVKLLDEAEGPVADGQPGRIFVGSVAAFEGYTGGGGKQVVDGLMATGDMGVLDAEGRLTVTGRDDDMIVSGGENVFPSEVEDLIADLDEVREVAVVGVDDDEFGKRLRAVVVLHEDGSLSEDDVKGAVKARLARYKVPRDVVFTDELPRTTTGKIVKRELA